jgi:hypothetical protein
VLLVLGAASIVLRPLTEVKLLRCAEEEEEEEEEELRRVQRLSRFFKRKLACTADALPLGSGVAAENHRVRRRGARRHDRQSAPRNAAPPVASSSELQDLLGPCCFSPPSAKEGCAQVAGVYTRQVVECKLAKDVVCCQSQSCCLLSL